MLRDGGRPARGRPELMGITKASLATESWLSAASFRKPPWCSPTPRSTAWDPLLRGSGERHPGQVDFGRHQAAALPRHRGGADGGRRRPRCTATSPTTRSITRASAPAAARPWRSGHRLRLPAGGRLPLIARSHARTPRIPVQGSAACGMMGVVSPLTSHPFGRHREQHRPTDGDATPAPESASPPAASESAATPAPEAAQPPVSQPPAVQPPATPADETLAVLPAAAAPARRPFHLWPRRPTGSSTCGRAGGGRAGGSYAAGSAYAGQPGWQQPPMGLPGVPSAPHRPTRRRRTTRWSRSSWRSSPSSCARWCAPSWRWSSRARRAGDQGQQRLADRRRFGAIGEDPGLGQHRADHPRRDHLPDHRHRCGEFARLRSDAHPVLLLLDAD